MNEFIEEIATPLSRLAMTSKWAAVGYSALLDSCRVGVQYCFYGPFGFAGMEYQAGGAAFGSFFAGGTGVDDPGLGLLIDDALVGMAVDDQSDIGMDPAKLLVFAEPAEAVALFDAHRAPG